MKDHEIRNLRYLSQNLNCPDLDLMFMVYRGK